MPTTSNRTSGSPQWRPALPLRGLRRCARDHRGRRAADGGAGRARAWFGYAARALLPGRGFYIWGGYSNIGNYPPALVDAGLYFSQAIIWVKEHPVLTRKDFMGNHEWCFYGWREGAAHYFDPTVNNETDVWSVKKVSPQKMVHLTEKPVELASRAMRLSSRPGETVHDLFGGSGSTLVAAEQLGRRARLMELDPLYCDVIVQRFEAFTGKKAEWRQRSVQDRQSTCDGSQTRKEHGEKLPCRHGIHGKCKHGVGNQAQQGQPNLDLSPLLQQ